MILNLNNINVFNVFLKYIANLIATCYCFCLRTASCQYFLPSVCCLHEVLNDWSGILTKNIAGSSGIELPILFASIESIDTFLMHGSIPAVTIPPRAIPLGFVFFCKNVVNSPPPGL